MASLYSKLRDMGHGRIQSLSRVIGYAVYQFIPPSTPTHIVELTIEDKLNELEEYVKSEYFSKNPSINKCGMRSIDMAFEFLNTQKNHFGDIFSASQLERYDSVLDQLTDS